MTWKLGGAMLVAVLALSLPASGSIIIDGDLSDWGVLAPTQQDYNDWTPYGLTGAAVWTEDWVLGDWDGGFVGPGYGGQIADIEALMLYLDGDTLYFATASGVPPWMSGEYIFPGDLFFDFGIDGTYDLGIETFGADTGSMWTGSGDSWYVDPPILYTEEGPYAIDESVATNLGPADGFVYNSDTYGFDHWIMEGAITLTDSELERLLDGVRFHWTEVCGNDVGNLDYQIVPEPATLVIFGLGLIGLASRRRFFA